MKAAPSAPQIPGHTVVKLLSSRGGFGDVYLFQEEALRREVAIKVIRDHSLEPSVRGRFEAEAKTMAALEHPNVVRIYGTGMTKDGRPYISMMYCPKPTMAERALGGRLSVHEVLDIGVCVAGAVESAHRAGVLHRDIKPANILTMPWGAPGLTDFGVAASLGPEADDDDVGVSIPWSPPEMLFTTTRGSRASDVYSLAATIWHLLVGRSPFELPSGDNTRMSLMSRIRDAVPPGTGRADVPSSLERILRRGMGKDPALRPQTVAELARSLQSVQMEMRLPVCPFVVLEGRSSDPPPVAPSRPGGPAGEPGEGLDRTRRRAPMGEAPVPSTSSGVQRVSPLGESGQSAAGPYAGRPLDGSSGTRPKDLEALTGDPPPGRSGARRAPVADDDPPIGTGLLVAGAAIVAVAALALGYVIFGRGDDRPDPGGPAPQVSQTRAESRPGAPAADVGEIEITAKRKGSTVTFTWTYDGQQDGDDYELDVEVDNGEPVGKYVEEPKYVVREVPQGSEACVVVQVVRKGIPISAASDRVCG